MAVALHSWPPLCATHAILISLLNEKRTPVCPTFAVARFVYKWINHVVAYCTQAGADRRMIYQQLVVRGNSAGRFAKSSSVIWRNRKREKYYLIWRFRFHRWLYVYGVWAQRQPSFDIETRKLLSVRRSPPHWIYCIRWLLLRTRNCSFTSKMIERRVAATRVLKIFR